MRIITWPGTSTLLSICIFANSIALCAFNPIDRAAASNTAIFYITLATTVIFTLEMVVKVIAFGCQGRGGFLRDPWNWLDVLIIAVGYAEFSRTASRVSGVRILRLVRPLQAFSGVRIILSTIVKALPGMASVIVLACLSYTLVALVGVQLWAGVMGGTCGYTDPSTGAWAYSPYAPTYDKCALPCTAFSGVCTWTFGDMCGVVYGGTINAIDGGNTSLAGNATIQMSCTLGVAPSEGQAQFDNFGRALMMAYVMVTTEGWST